METPQPASLDVDGLALTDLEVRPCSIASKDSAPLIQAMQVAQTPVVTGQGLSQASQVQSQIQTQLSRAAAQQGIDLPEHLFVEYINGFTVGVRLTSRTTHVLDIIEAAKRQFAPLLDKVPTYQLCLSTGPDQEPIKVQMRLTDLLRRADFPTDNTLFISAVMDSLNIGIVLLR